MNNLDETIGGGEGRENFNVFHLHPFLSYSRKMNIIEFIKGELIASQTHIQARMRQEQKIKSLDSVKERLLKIEMAIKVLETWRGYEKAYFKKRQGAEA